MKEQLATEKALTAQGKHLQEDILSRRDDIIKLLDKISRCVSGYCTIRYHCDGIAQPSYVMYDVMCYSMSLVTNFYIIICILAGKLYTDLH